MAIQIANSYSGNSAYTVQKNSNTGKTAKSDETKASEKAASSQEHKNVNDYLQDLQQKYPELNISSGLEDTSIRYRNGKNVNDLRIDPKILSQMASDPQAAKKYEDMISGLPAAIKWADSVVHSIGSEVKYRQTWIDENGDMGSFCVTGPSEEKMKKYAQQKEKKAELLEKEKEDALEKREKVEELLKKKMNETVIPEDNTGYSSRFDAKI